MAARLEMLKEQFFDNDGAVLSGGLLYTYVVGGTTAKATYTTALGDVEQANPVVLDTSGRVATDLYGVGAYRIVIKDSAGTTLDTIPTVSGVNSASMTTIGDYSGDLDNAITLISTTPTTLIIDETATLSANTTVPATCQLSVVHGGTINQSTYSLTINGAFDAPSQKVFTGTGTVSFGSMVHEILVEWMGDVDGTADDVQINAAITAASVNQKVKAYASSYTCSSAIALNKSVVLELGDTVITSTADPAVQITADDVTIRGTNRRESQIKNTTATENVIRSVGATRTGITIENLYLQGAGSTYAAQARETEQLIWFGDDPDAGTHTNIVIQNCFLTQALNGILLEFTDDSKIINNIFSNTNAGLIQLNLWSCNRVLIEGNNFIDTGGFSDAIEINHNSDDPSIGCIINGNTFNGPYLETINLLGHDHVVSDNYIYSNGAANHQGIQVLQVDTDAAMTTYQNLITGNVIEMTNAASGYAISLKDYNSGDYGVQRCIISNNIIKHDGNAVVITGSGKNINDNIIKGNQIYCTGDGAVQDGIYFASNMTGNIIEDNRIDGAGRYGIYGNTAEALTINNNKVTDSVNHGIYVVAGSNHSIDNNRSWSNGGYGICLTSAADVNRFYGNLAYSNTTYDIVVGTGVVNTEKLTGTITIDNAFASAYIDSSGGAVTATLGSGLYIGQIKTIVMSEDSTSSTVIVTNHDDVDGIPAYDGSTPSGDGEIGTFDAVDEAWVLIWTGTEWTTLRATCTFV